MASAVNAGDGGQSRHDATIIAELRDIRGRIGAKLSMSVTLEEVDALLRAVDERDELRRQTVGDWEPEFPPVTVSSVTLPMNEEELSLGIPTAAEWFDSRPKSAGPAMSCPRRDTIHDCPLGGCADDSPRPSEIPDLPVEEDEEPWSLTCAVVSPPEWAGEFTRCELPAGHEGAHFDGAFPWEDRPIGREERETPPEPREITHAVMCGVGSSGSCFVPWCSCDCHTRRSDVAPAR